jgi:hypothetical protein
MTDEKWAALILCIFAIILAIAFATCIVFVTWQSLEFVLVEVTK